VYGELERVELSSPFLRLVYAHTPAISLRSRPKHPRQLALCARGELAFLVNTASYNVRWGAWPFVPTGNPTAPEHIVLRSPLALVTDLCSSPIEPGDPTGEELPPDDDVQKVKESW
jgi:hypothetical protein